MGSSHPVVLWLWWQYFSTKRQIQLLFYLFIYFLCDFLLHGLFAKNDNKDSNNIFTYLRCIHVRFTREQIRFWQRLNLTLLLIHFLSFFFFFFFLLFGRYFEVGQTKVERRRAKPAVQSFSGGGSSWYVGVWRLGRSTDQERSVEMELW